MNPRSFFAFLCFVALCIAPAEAVDKPAPKLLFVGNSITLHGPAEKIGWTGKWGMAASALDKDYVHLVVAAVAKQSGTVPEFQVVNIADYERAYETVDVAAKLKDALAFQADTAILCIGENVPALKTDEEKGKFKESVTKLMTLLRHDGKTALFVRSCFWADAAKDMVLKEACAAVGGTFVDIGTLGKDEANYARSERKFENAGVARHPGDRGMQAIADAISSALAKAAK